MTELQITETVLLTLAGWILITLAAKDVVQVFFQSLGNGKSSQSRSPLSRSSSFWITSAFGSAERPGRGGRFVLKYLNVLLPLIQIILWKSMLITGFALLYLSISLQTHEGVPAFEYNLSELVAALWLSSHLSFRIVPFEPVFKDSAIFLIACIQFYQGLLFYAFICFYMLILRRKARQVQPRLFNLKSEVDDNYSPLYFSDKLRRSYGTNNLVLILQDWQSWSESIKVNLPAHPHLIFSEAPGSGSPSWVTGLAVVLDTSAALIVTADCPLIEKRAKKVFASARRALLEITDCLEQLQIRKKDRQYFNQKYQNKTVDDDIEILSAEVIFDPDEISDSLRQIEMFETWQFTYQSSLRSLSDRLGIKIPSWKSDKHFC